jgi:ketosteroid isomerase-like protein
MATENSKRVDETQIRDLIDGWVKSLGAKDVDRLMSYYAPDILLFDLLAQSARPSGLVLDLLRGIATEALSTFQGIGLCVEGLFLYPVGENEGS